ncbi:MAG: LysR family substrate-binding domain-containing protein, partial [Chthoniobacterales bacterium]
LPLRLLANERFLLPERGRAPLFNPWLIVLCQQAGFQPQLEEISGQSISVLSLVAAGAGITLLPSQFSRLGLSGLRFIPLSRPAPAYRYCATWLKNNSHPTLSNFVKTATAIGKKQQKLIGR